MLPRDAGVVTLDSALRAGVRREDLERLLASRRGARAARRALALTDSASGSVPESEARLLFRAAGLRPVSQLRVRLGDRSFKLDFGWPESMTLVEIDGRRWHIDAKAFQLDRTRHNQLVMAGWLVLRFTVEDIRLRPDYVVQPVRQALDR